MVEAALIGGADVHAGTLADAGEALELVDFRGVVEIERDVWEGGVAVAPVFGFFYVLGAVLGIVGRGGIGGLIGHRNSDKREANNISGAGGGNKG
jgi:hypothetical protein